MTMFEETKKQAVAFLRQITATNLTEMTTDEVTAFAAKMQEEVPHLIDLATRLMDMNDVMAAKLADPSRAMRINLRAFIASTAEVLHTNLDNFSPLVRSTYLFDLYRLCHMVGYQPPTATERDDMLDGFKRIASDAQNDALWDEVTGRFKGLVGANAVDRAAS